MELPAYQQTAVRLLYNISRDEKCLSMFAYADAINAVRGLPLRRTFPAAFSPRHAPSYYVS